MEKDNLSKGLNRRQFVVGATSFFALQLFDTLSVANAADVDKYFRGIDMILAPSAKLVIKKDKKVIPFYTEGTWRHFKANELDIDIAGKDAYNNFYIDNNLPEFVFTEIFLETEYGLQSLYLSTELMEKISIIINKLKDVRFDCVCFAKYVNGFYIDNSFDIDNWKIEVLEDDFVLLQGETVMFSQNNILETGDVESIKHFALHLGNQLYFSKLGPDGKIVITDLEAMKNAYECDYTFVVQNKENIEEVPHYGR